MEHRIAMQCDPERRLKHQDLGRRSHRLDELDVRGGFGAIRVAGEPGRRGDRREDDVGRVERRNLQRVIAGDVRQSEAVELEEPDHLTGAVERQDRGIGTEIGVAQIGGAQAAAAAGAAGAPGHAEFGQPADPQDRHRQIERGFAIDGDKGLTVLVQAIDEIDVEGAFDLRRRPADAEQQVV